MTRSDLSGGPGSGLLQFHISEKMCSHCLLLLSNINQVTFLLKLLYQKSYSTYFSMYASPMNTLRSWTKEGSISSSVGFLLLRMTPRKIKTEKELDFFFSPYDYQSCDWFCFNASVSECTQRRIKADTHQVKPKVFYIFSRVEFILSPLKRFVRRLRDQPVVRLSTGGVNNAGIALQVQKQLDGIWREKK